MFACRLHYMRHVYRHAIMSLPRTTTVQQALLCLVAQLFMFSSEVACSPSDASLTSTHLSSAGVLEEAEFYNITSLIKLLKDNIRERDCRTSQVCWKHHAV